MCNNLHSDSKPIPKSGYGWKIIILSTGTNQTLSAVDHSIYTKNERGIIEWSNKTGNGGFCFFLTKKEALRANKSWDWTRYCQGKQKIVKIRYFDGMGKHQEIHFITNHTFEIALCKKFRFVK